MNAAAEPASIITANAGIAAIASVGLTNPTISNIRGNNIELAISALRAADIAVSGASATAREIPIVYAVVEASAPTTAVRSAPRSSPSYLGRKLPMKYTTEHSITTHHILRH